MLDGHLLAEGTEFGPCCHGARVGDRGDRTRPPTADTPESSPIGHSCTTGSLHNRVTPAGATPAVDEDAPAPATKPAVINEFDDEEPAVATAPVAAKASTDKAQDILAMIRSRQKA